MNTYYDQSTLADQHREKLMREAEAHRLSLQVEQPGLGNRVLANVGEWMIAEGTRLKKRTAENRTAQSQRAERSLLTVNRYS